MRKLGVDFWLALCYIINIIRKQKEGKMLSLIGLFAIAFVVVKFFPDILMFCIKAAIVLIGLYFLLGALLWIFGASIALNINGALLGI